jgi:predicted dehydrogenase
MKAKYRVAVIGRTGRGDYGHGLDTVWLDVPDVEIVAVADENEEGRKATAAKLGVTEVYADYREMLDKARPDVVSIGPRWIDAHRDMIVAALERKVHVYVEKPFCRTLAEADEIASLCESTGCKLAIAHQTQYSPKLHVVREMIADGKIGKLLEVRGRGKEDVRGGGEDLWVLGSHVMALIRSLAGEAEWCMASVMKGSRPVTKADVVEGPEGIGPIAGDAIAAMYGLAEGTTAYFNSVRSAAGQPSRFGLTLYGTAGVIEILTGYVPSVKYLADPSWSPGRSGAKWQDVSSNGLGQPETLSDGGLGAGNVLAVLDLLDAIEQDRQPECSVYEARATIEMIAAVFESARTGARANLPLPVRDNPLVRWGG